MTTDPAPRVRHFLDLSTSHLPHDTMQALAGLDNVVAHQTAYGALLWVPDDPTASAHTMDDPVPDEVLTVQLYARSLGCDYVLFDRDAEVDDRLPTWPW